MKKFFHIIKKILSNKYFLPYLTIVILSLLPVLYTWGRLVVGGDVMIFLDTQVLEKKYLYQWVTNASNGGYFSTSYYAIYGIYKLLSFLHLNIYLISSVLLFILNFIAGTGIFKLTFLLSKKSPSYVYIIPISFYLLSPALFVAWHYNFIYSFIPLFFYIIFKVVKNRDMSIKDSFLLTAVLLFSSTELPNPKYIFLLFMTFLIVFVSAICMKMINIKDFKKIFLKLILTITLSSYLLLPLAFFARNYSPENYNVHVRTGYTDEGQLMNKGVDTIDRVLRLHQDFIFLNQAEATRYSKNRLVTLLSYSFILLIVFDIFKINDLSAEKKKYRVLFLILLACFIFFSAGPNLPLGYFYEQVVTRINLFAFLRTTAGGVFFLSAIYAVYLFLFLNDLNKYKKFLTVSLLLVICAVGYPFLNGEYYRNMNYVSKFTDRTKNGFILPQEYYQIKKILDSKKLDAKIYYPNSSLVYLNTTWGFWGPVIYNFLYQNELIGFDKIYSNLANHNVGYIMIDHSLLEKEDYSDIEGKILIEKDNFIELYKYNKENFLPHFYTPKQVIISDESPASLKGASNDQNSDIRLASILKSQNKEKNLKDIPLKQEETPIIEYKKINNTKYNLIIHNAKGNFPIVFSESFDSGWKVYPKQKDDYSISDLLKKTDTYRAIAGNEDDQVTKSELVDFVNRGLISDLGNKTTNFVSKNFQDTIQNDNLSSGSIIDTWSLSSIPEKDHFKVNAYANLWTINIDSICRQNIKCKKTDNGYDLELIIEFWPQRLVYYGLIISFMTIFTGAAFFVIILFKSKHEKK